MFSASRWPAATSAGVLAPPMNCVLSQLTTNFPLSLQYQFTPNVSSVAPRTDRRGREVRKHVGIDVEVPRSGCQLDRAEVSSRGVDRRLHVDEIVGRVGAEENERRLGLVRLVVDEEVAVPGASDLLIRAVVSPMRLKGPSASYRYTP